MEPTSGDAPTIEQWNGISPSLRGFCHERRGSSGDDEPSPEKGDAPKRTKFRPKLAPPPLQSAEGSGADAVLSPKVVETMRQLHLTPLRGKEQPGGGAYQPRKEEPSGARGVSEADEETAEPARGRHPRQAPTEPNEVGSLPPARCLSASQSASLPLSCAAGGGEADFPLDSAGSS